MAFIGGTPPPFGQLGHAPGKKTGRYGRPGQDVSGGHWITIEGRHVLIKESGVESDIRGTFADTGESTIQDVAQTMEGSKFETGKKIGSRAQGNLNETYTAMAGGVKVIWKPKSGEYDGVERAGMVSGEQYKKEALAWDLAQQMGMEDLVLPTVIRQGYGGIGAAQLYVRGQEAAFVPGDGKWDGQEDAARAAAWDYFVGNTDRHAKNWFIDDVHHRIALIDHGLAFPPNDSAGFRGGLRSALISHAKDYNWSVPSDARHWIQQWDDIRATVEDYHFRQQDQILNAMHQRLLDLSHGHWPRRIVSR